MRGCTYSFIRPSQAASYSSEAFYALDDPLEAAVFSVLVEMVKKMDKADREKDIYLKSAP